jgi:hypothetical protein
MARAFIVFLVCFVALGACTQRLICPAYQSAFIYDQDALRKKFSYFNEDSTPKVLTASKNKYLIAEPVSYHKKVRSLQTVEMKPVYVVVPDSLKDDFNVSMAEMDSATNSVIDSTYIVDVNVKKDSAVNNGEDSIYVITKDRELRLLKYDADSIKYKVVDVRLNVDQDNYMWYFRDLLVLPDVRLAMEEGKVEKEVAESGKKGKKSFLQRIKDLFKKKPKSEQEAVDSTTVKRNPDDLDLPDSASNYSTPKPVVKPAEKKKKGLFGKKSKAVAPKKKEDAAPKKKDEAKKEKKENAKKEEDEGF